MLNIRQDKSHPKFVEVENVEAALYSACDQMDGNPAKIVSIGKAVKEVSDPKNRLLLVFIKLINNSSNEHVMIVTF